MTLDALYLFDGRACRSSENRVSNINMLEIYHEIRWNLKNKAFREESMTQVGLYAIGTYTTLASNKSHC